MTCVKLRTGLEVTVFARVWLCMTSDRLSFAPVEIDKNYSLTRCHIRYPGGKVCVTGDHVTSHNHCLSPNDDGDRGERA